MWKCTWWWMEQVTAFDVWRFGMFSWREKNMSLILHFPQIICSLLHEIHVCKLSTKYTYRTTQNEMIGQCIGFSDIIQNNFLHDNFLSHTVTGDDLCVARNTWIELTVHGLRYTSSLSMINRSFPLGKYV